MRWKRGTCCSASQNTSKKTVRTKPTLDRLVKIQWFRSFPKPISNVLRGFKTNTQCLVPKWFHCPTPKSNCTINLIQMDCSWIKCLSTQIEIDQKFFSNEFIRSFDDSITVIGFWVLTTFQVTSKHKNIEWIKMYKVYCGFNFANQSNLTTFFACCAISVAFVNCVR